MEEEDHQQRKKRKLDEPEEEKVEEFFALIRSTREARDRLRSNNCNSSGGLDQKKDYNLSDLSNGDKGGNRVIAAKEIAVWNPTFQPEDFLDGHDHEKKIDATLPLADSVIGSTSQLLPDVVGASKMEEEEEEEEGKEEKKQKLQDNKGGTDQNNDNNNINNIDLELSL